MDYYLERYFKKLELVKEIQRLCNFENGDYFYDPVCCEVKIYFFYSSYDFSGFIWIPRQDQYQEMCIDFFIKIMGLSRHDAFTRFLEWYSSCLQETAETGRISKKGGKIEYIDSCDELMLEYTMNMIFGQKWDGKKWVKEHEGWISDSKDINLYMRD